MIRFTILYSVIAFLSVYAFKDWYKSLCGLIIFMGIYQHADIRGSILGFQGLNPWNILQFFVLCGWGFSKRYENLKWDMPAFVNVILLLYLSVISVAALRMLFDPHELIRYAIITNDEIPSTDTLLNEYLINCIKWVIPGLLLFHGCNSRSRFIWGIFSLLAIYFLLGLQVIHRMPLSAITGGESLAYRSSRILVREVGYSRVNLSTLLAGASWAIFTSIAMLKNMNRKYSIVIALAGLMVIYAQALTGGRAGYVAWVTGGLILCFFRWRKILILIPIVILILMSTIPGLSDRMISGIGQDSVDEYALTSGRNLAWPRELEKIEESPWIGYGRMSMQRTGISTDIWLILREHFPHPHNAYLEWLLDNGLIGFLPVFIFYFIVLKYSISLLRDKRSPIFITIGGITLSIVSVLLIASFGSQTFYPREGAVAMWCAIGLMFRVYNERSRLITASHETSPDSIDGLLWSKPAVRI